MSVAPVTDWALYGMKFGFCKTSLFVNQLDNRDISFVLYRAADSIYTERFMGLPSVADNLDGYEQAQLLNKAENIKPNSYYLIHGTLDDNVHYQQSLMLAKVLEQKDILFRQQVI